MSEAEKLERIHCNRCNRFTVHDVLCEDSQSHTPDNTPEMEIDFAEGHWRILKCRGCEERTFEEVWYTSEDLDKHGNPEPQQKLFPPRGRRAQPLYNLPHNVRVLYCEVIEALNNNLRLLCAGGLRALVEGICVERGIKEGLVPQPDGTTKKEKNIQGKIFGLVEAGVLTSKHAQVLHEYRFLGNEALHELLQPSHEELELAVSIIEHTLENIYELEHKAEKLRLEKQMRIKLRQG